MPSAERGYITTALVLIGIGTFVYSVVIGQVIIGGAVATSVFVIAVLMSDADIDSGVWETEQSLRRVEGVSLLPPLFVIGLVVIIGDALSGIFVFAVWPLASGIAFVVIGATTVLRVVSDQLSPEKLAVAFLSMYIGGWVVIFGIDYILWSLGFEAEPWIQQVGILLTTVAMLGLAAHVLIRDFIPWNGSNTDERL